MATFASLADFTAAVGTELGSSEWLTVDQDRINLFAEATGDHQWIHVDPERAAAGPFGTTIAHGYLTLSLIPALVKECYSIEGGLRMAVNYGSDKVRFPAPVPVGSTIRATAELVSVTEVAGGVQAVVRVTISNKDGGKPHCVADTITRFYV
ncbi:MULTISPECIES: MaoC family dehydratase [Streptacidiphilus]|uniref:MaoC family dehydratase n=1 Tax=Streptacidiphilus cavernicola TaxID=3342716 RepID=A0ABV6UUK4_9ACTN|nr:MaoC family dehydratase [Streptacidiphilus jeojiense]